MRILEVEATEIHQRTPMFIGSKLMMEEFENTI
jgi:fructose-1,6-bisphosphatase